MAKKLINRTGDAEVSYDGDLLADQMFMFDVASDIEMTGADVFANEGELDQEPGGERLIVQAGFFLAWDDAESFVPIPGPQNKAWIFTFTAGCLVSGNFDTRGARMTRVTNVLASGSITLFSKPGWSVTWDITPTP